MAGGVWQAVGGRWWVAVDVPHTHGGEGGREEEGRVKEGRVCEWVGEKGGVRRETVCSSGQPACSCASGVPKGVLP